MPVTPGNGPKASLTAGTPTKLFTIWGNALTTRGRPYDVSRDGKRFLAIKAPPAAAGPQAPFVFVVNWIEELKAKVAGKSILSPTTATAWRGSHTRPPRWSPDEEHLATRRPERFVRTSSELTEPLHVRIDRVSDEPLAGNSTRVA